MSGPLVVEHRRFSRPVSAQRALLSRRVRALEDPVLPRAQAREDFRFHGLGSGKSKIGFETGESIGGKARSLLKKYANLVIPIHFVEGEGDETEFIGGLGVERFARFGSSPIQNVRIGEEAS